MYLHVSLAHTHTTQEIEDTDSGVPQFEGDPIMPSTADGASTVNHAQSNGESGLGADSAEDSGEEDDEYGNIRIVELHKEMEYLGIRLTHYTSPEGM